MTEREYFEKGFRADQPMEKMPLKWRQNVAFDAARKRERLVKASPVRKGGFGMDTGGMSNYKVAGHQTALKPTVIIPVPAASPSSIMPTTIVPIQVAQPTGGMGGSRVPWTMGPEASLVAFAAAIPLGTLLIQLGRTVIAQIALMGMEEAGQRLLGMSHRGDVKIRAHTGKSGGDKTSYVRPRGEGGEMPPSDADPYAEPDDDSWWQFWTWF